MSKLSSSKFLVCVHNVVRMHESVALFWVNGHHVSHLGNKAPINIIMYRKQRQLGQEQLLHFFLNTTLIAVQPTMAEYEWTMYQLKVE